MFKKVYLHLLNRGFDVYASGQHKGICQKPYVVIRERSEEPFSLGLVRVLVDFVVYYPMDYFSELEEYVEQLKDALDDLRELKDTREVSEAEIDSEKKAYARSVTYGLIKKRR